MFWASKPKLAAKIATLSFISNLSHDTAWEMAFGPFFATLLVGMLFLIMKWLLMRSLNRWFVLGYVGLVISSTLIMQLATTIAWDRFASYLLR